jgi:3-hydroxyisobutyrate dehydrogenase
MARKIIRAGAVGSGQALKVVLNGLGAQHLVAFASMLHLGLRAGLSREAIVDAFTSGTFATPAYVSKRDRVLAGDYTGADFTLDLALKDVQLCAELAREVSMTIAQHERAREEIEKGVAAGLGGFDLYALERIYEQS